MFWCYFTTIRLNFLREVFFTIAFLSQGKLVELGVSRSFCLDKCSISLSVETVMVETILNLLATLPPNFSVNAMTPSLTTMVRL